MLVNIHNIKTQVEVSTPEEAIIACGTQLIESGLVRDSYIHAMIDVFHQLGAYIVIAPHVALPHASPDNGAIASGICITSLKNPIYFGHQDNDPVHVLIGLASHDGISHIETLQKMAEFLSLEENISKLINCQTESEIKNLFVENTNDN